MGDPDRKRKVVILGGGVGAMTAAFELSRDGWEQRFSSITVHQLGWRLGGKGASGRGVHDRIEEHGLHVWLGFYENAFRLMRDCYAELGRSQEEPLATVEEAFQKASTFVVQEWRPEGWAPWVATFPEDDQEPGDPADPTPLPSLREYLTRSVELAVRFLVSVLPGGDVGATAGATISAPTESDGVVIRPARESRSAVLRRELESLGGLLAGDGRIASLALGAVVELLDVIGDDTERRSPAVYDRLESLIERVIVATKRHLRPIVSRSDAARRSWYVADMFLACARGILRHDLLHHPEGIDAIDDFDFADWLMLNGADEESARSSLVTTVLYDLAFAYRHGDPAQPSFSAATGLRGLFRMFFTYKGAIAWKMTAGMGDVVFAPLYEVLKARGVKFEFFHKVESLRLSPDGRSIRSIEVTRQADLLDPGAGYDPLVDVKNLPCWPSRPLFDQLVDGDAIEQDALDLESFWNERRTGSLTLEAGTDFDVVVLGISLGALPFVCSDLVQHNPAWARMVENVETIYTQAFQLWLSKPTDELVGRPWPFATTGGYLEPFDTFADMRQLIEVEGYDPPPRAIAYFCNAMPTPPGPSDRNDASIPVRATALVKKNAIRFLSADMIPIWPGAVRRYPSDFRWELLVAPGPEEGVDRFDTQFWRANIDPSERYVLSIPGSTRYRLRPGASGYSNLVLAGDWTRGGLNAGYVEGAVISGMLASNAVWGRPDLDTIVGNEQP